MKCPGQDMKYWKADAIFNAHCPQCSAPVEFYKDDTSRKCSHCGHRFVNPKMDFGCASYCQYAEQCLGTLPEEFSGAQDTFLKEKVAIEMKKFYQTDFKSIRRAMATARFAEDISKTEGGNPAIVLCAAYLYDTGSVPKKIGSRRTNDRGDLRIDGPRRIHSRSRITRKENLTRRLGTETIARVIARGFRRQCDKTPNWFKSTFNKYGKRHCNLFCRLITPSK